MHCDAYKYGDATYNIGLLDNLSSYNVLLLPGNNLFPLEPLRVNTF